MPKFRDFRRFWKFWTSIANYKMYLELFHRNRIQNLGHFQAFNVKTNGLYIFEIFKKFSENGCFTKLK